MMNESKAETSSMAGKQTRGRQKITMKMIEKEDDRLITFSKRRSGIYKKASELVTLCGAEVGVLVFSPSGKPFSFGHPSMESVANRFLCENPLPSPTAASFSLVEAHRKARINELTQQYNELLRQLEGEKERGRVLKQMTTGKGNQGWWEAAVDEISMQELQQMNAMLGELQSNLSRKINEKSIASSSSSVPHPSFNNGGTHFMGSSQFATNPYDPFFLPFPPGLGFGSDPF